MRTTTDAVTKIVSTDDYMPMAINSQEEYQKVLDVSWYTGDKNIEELTYVPFYNSDSLDSSD